MRLRGFCVPSDNHRNRPESGQKESFTMMLPTRYVVTRRDVEGFILEDIELPTAVGAVEYAHDMNVRTRNVGYSPDHHPYLVETVDGVENWHPLNSAPMVRTADRLHY